MAAIGQIMAHGVLVLALVGCARGFDPVGRWDGQQALFVAPDTDVTIAHTARKVILVVDDKGGFTLLQRGLTLTGDWRRNGSDLLLSPRLVLNRPITGFRPDIRVKPRLDGTISLEDPSIEGPPAVLKRDLKP